MVALRARVQDAEARLENLENVRRDLDFLRDRVWDLPRQLDEEAERLRTRCSRGEENDASVRQVLERHLDWIRTLNDRVGSLEVQEARRVAARAPAPASLGRARSGVGERLPEVLCDPVGSTSSTAPAG
ncbi:hypothetical protein PF007_g4832 [Phytophthora fragariae]|nr:hypothetical protein PF003_g17311 [Phytophthora fragariae]KAE8945062.1 hypothetical protein PF009_g5282 [Phytophthora fragariae]KAE9129562.1 hypothetical protein PF007_g4832 [Phytophthora fragariae]KAE9132254.1 hypothetical protein PF006_g15323 [Phytophthora fragariae]KAE9324457.1 hypothetical protein PF001_g3411 [Phytophthora fragariae]